MNEFFDTEAGRHIAYAKQYLEGALTLDEAQKIKGKILRLPTLALASHGLELMLKACIYLNVHESNARGRNGHKIARMCGHKVAAMWGLDICEPVRRHALFHASSVL